jgi:hypothetical protein
MVQTNPDGLVWLAGQCRGWADEVMVPDTPTVGASLQASAAAVRADTDLIKVRTVTDELRGSFTRSTAFTTCRSSAKTTSTTGRPMSREPRCPPGSDKSRGTQALGA